MKNRIKFFLVFMLSVTVISLLICGFIGKKTSVSNDKLAGDFVAVVNNVNIYEGGGGSSATTQSCPIGCNCNSSGGCTSCKKGYVLSNGKCIKYELKSTIKFDANGGTGTMNKQIVKNNVSTKLQSNTFTKRGYDFKEWNTKSDGSGTVYKDGGNIKTTSGIILYAMWTPKTYVVTANANGGVILYNSEWKYIGDGTAVKKSLIYGTTYGKLPVPLRSGYTFDGWYTAKTGGKEVLSTTPVYTIVNYTMYARWTKNEEDIEDSKIIFKNGGTDEMVSQTIKNNTSTPLKENTFKKSGYSFNGWSTKIDGSGTNYSNKNNITVNSDLVLFAKWKANTYTVTANANGGTISSYNGWTKTSNTTATKQLTYATTYGDLPVPVRDGYIFDGWYTSKTEGKIVVSTTKVYTVVNYTMYARWQEIGSVIISFDSNDGSNQLIKQKVSSNKLTTLSENKFKRSGYTFIGWNTKTDGSGTTYQNKGSIQVSANTTLYAMWKANTYTVTADANGGTISSYNGWTKTSDATATKQLTYATTYGNLPVPVKSGYKFVGWYTAKTEGKVVVSTTKVYTVVNYTMYARWVEDKVTISFNANGGTGHMNNQKVSRGVDTILNVVIGYNKSGYTFTGWNTKSDGSGTSYANQKKINISSNTTLYAMWKVNTYTITADANGGTISSLNGWTKASTTTTTKQLTYGKTYGDLPVPVRDGYKFIGWYISKTSSKEVLSTTKVYATANYTMYARWKVKTNNTVTLYFDKNGGTGSMGTQDVEKGAAITIRENKGFYTRDGYTFTGWNTKKDGKGTSYKDKGSITLTQDTTLFAQWKRDTYTITFDGNGDTNTMPKQVVNSKEATKLNANTFKNSGYVFTGWNTKKDGKGTSYSDKQSVKLTSNLTLYAQWAKKEEHTIKFELNGGSTKSPLRSKKVYYGDKLPNLDSNDIPTRTGYVFLGWYDGKAAFVSKQYYNKKNEPTRSYDKTSDLTLYAVWEKKIAEYKYDKNYKGTRSLEYDIREYTNAAGGTSLITKIWVDDPYNQMKVAIASSYPSTEKHYTIISNEVKNKGYKEKALVAINASPMISDRFYPKAPRDWDGQPAINTFVNESKPESNRTYKDKKNGKYTIFDSGFLTEDPTVFVWYRYAAGIGKDGKLKSFQSAVSWTTMTQNPKYEKLYKNFKSKESTVNKWLEDNKIQNTFGFGPVLLQDGERMQVPKSDDEKKYLKAKNAWASNGQRQAVCQIDAHNFIFITDTVEGKKQGSSFNSLADLMVALGCKTGYNLDGGGSRAFAFKKGTTGTYKLHNSNNIYGFDGYSSEWDDSYNIRKPAPDSGPYPHSKTNLNYMNISFKNDRRGADMLYFVEK